MQIKNHQTNIWENIWQSVINDPLKRHEKDTQRHLQRWDKKAKGFLERASEPEATQRKQNTIRLLKNEGVLTKDTKVLDIGAGPGNWAISFAQEVAHVTALEPSKEMVMLLKQRMDENNINNISVDQRTWESVHLNEDQYDKQFDLVFASMTPGVNSPETLKKMIGASKKFCYLSCFSGQGWRESYAQLWHDIVGKPLGPNPGDIIYPFTVIYGMGYKPSLHFEQWTYVREDPVDSAIEDVLYFFEDYIDITDTIHKQVTEAIKSQSTDGIFRKEKLVSQGIMLWKVAQ
ncbi:MAG: SAM-dependent methyltransferase [Candidatus Magnetoglobus multicellularis str. Araruama]|uniref:SAM-dependent methyltransferase n=1 Tax=Candidatus Magnetoglobus multicellularis str. Araruama TaxID=890399 RepID=A0A1V1PA44_9BACT|nr:MAG: SAM-dependent methyltransferase [Candidatus Magnetoglobus multicellularis str. Araruama]